MGAGDVPWSDVERCKAGPPIGSGCGPTRIGRAAEPRFTGSVVPSIVVGSARLTASHICALRASACGLPIRPVLKHGPRSLTCVRVNGRVNPYGVRKLIGGIPLRVHRRPTLIF
jgi:hypothetical protein